jgi:hypothetical protein
MKKFFEEEEPERFVEWEPPTPQTKYSQPLPETRRFLNAPTVFAGFVNGKPGFIFTENGKQKRVEASKTNSAVTAPSGFFRSLARMFGGSR